MAEIIKAGANGPLMQSQKQPPTLQLVLALGAMALKRGADPIPKTLEIYAESMVRSFDLADCLAVIEQVADAPQGDREKAFPDYGTLKMLIEERHHPLRHLREIVRKMALNFGVRVTPEMLQNFEQFCGHRTDEDLDHALEQVMRSATITKMPTTGQFRDACGIMRVRRDGKQPQ
ncbi:MAG: hypothetical protein KGL39_36345 [Patescibacteria group bacterium]|nr:hypothetical protein [Patescibacteria group bacterium]